MIRLEMSFLVLGLLLLVVVACSKSGADDGDEVGSHPAENKVVPETAAPLQPAGKEFRYNFDSDAAGKLPAKFHEALTGQGAKAQWVVKEDQSAPSQPNVLAQTSTDKTDYRFPLAIFDAPVAADVEVVVKFKPVAGEVDRAAGIAVRLTDKDNYYVVRANALEDNVRLYRVVKGQRIQFAGANLKVRSGAWQELRILARGSRFEVSFDGRRLYDATDSTFANAGRVALWTKADSITHFDDLRINTA